MEVCPVCLAPVFGTRGEHMIEGWIREGLARNPFFVVSSVHAKCRGEFLVEISPFNTVEVTAGKDVVILHPAYDPTARDDSSKSVWRRDEAKTAILRAVGGEKNKGWEAWRKDPVPSCLSSKGKTKYKFVLGKTKLHSMVQALKLSKRNFEIETWASSTPSAASSSGTTTMIV